LTLRATPREAYGENDELEVQVELTGTKLFGTASIFDDHRQLGWLCDVFDGFPCMQGTGSKFEMGIFSRLKLTIGTNSKGRLEVQAALVVPIGGVKLAEEGLTIGFLCDPAALDSFCESVRSFSPGVECEATLQGRSWE
jgi:hypothetical protein